MIDVGMLGYAANVDFKKYGSVLTYAFACVRTRSTTIILFLCCLLLLCWI